MRISDWSSDVCSSDLSHEAWARLSASNPKAGALLHLLAARVGDNNAVVVSHKTLAELLGVRSITTIMTAITALVSGNWIEVRRIGENGTVNAYVLNDRVVWSGPREGRSEEHTSELQSIMRNSYAVFCLKKKKNIHDTKDTFNIMCAQIE